MHGVGPAPFWALVAWWWAMMAVMMLPVTWPWLRALRRLSAAPRSPVAGGTWDAGGLPATVVPAFVAGYLGVWLGFSIGAAGLQVVFVPHGGAEPVVQAGVLLAAGIYQLTPAKTACLKHCRSPVGVLLARWPLDTDGALRMGLEHGIFCLGCCWALMLLGLGAGAAGWIWMGGLVVLVAAEKWTRPGPRLARWAGVGLVAASLFVASGRI